LKSGESHPPRVYLRFKGKRNSHTRTPPLRETFYNEDLAKTLEQLAAEGLSSFYTGSIASDMVAASRNAVNPRTGKYGLMTAADLASYLPVYREPISVTYRGHRVYGFPPPASGGIAMLQIVNYLEAFDLPTTGPLNADSVHPIIDSQNMAFADRNKYIGDADFVDVPVQGLIDKEYMRNRRNSMANPVRAIPTPIPPGKPEGAPKYATVLVDHEKGTTHWSIVDESGNAVSFTSTIEQVMGSGVVVPNRGFLLNNELTDFEDYESDASGLPYANAPAGGKMRRRTALGNDSTTSGGKRPRSSMTPTIVFNTTGEALYLLTGSPGGSSIIGATANVLLNIVDFGIDLQEATNMGRVLGKNTETSAESEIYEHDDGALFAELNARGFNFTTPYPTTATYGQVQSVMVGQDGNLYGAADSKRNTMAWAAGF